MAKNTINWEDIGRNVQDIVDHAISSQDYQKLNQTIRQVVDRAMDIGEEVVRKAVDNTGSRTQTAQPVQSVKKLDLSLYYAPTGGKTALNIVKIVGGSLIAIFSASLFTASAVIGLFLTGEALLPAIAVPPDPPPPKRSPH